MNGKRKIINDPVFGFINIPSGFIYDLIKHPYLQRLHRIRQLGLASLVYPGAQHTRFHHSLGAMHLMMEALTQLKLKSVVITEEETEAALAAILLHDVGHGPFSHALEYTLVRNMNHERISQLMIEDINKQYQGKLSLALQIFQDTYHKHFLHQLVSGQLDVDRLDYLRRDSFFTGVVEGNIGSARIIKMLQVREGRLVIEEKGIYSIENFLIARRMMYGQVYLHKTALAAEKMLINILRRAKDLAEQNIDLFGTPALRYFLYNDVGPETFTSETLEKYASLDDNDIWCALKVWQKHPDFVLSTLSTALVNRELFKTELSSEPFADSKIEEMRREYVRQFSISEHEAGFFVSTDSIATNLYKESDESIEILTKSGEVKDVSKASDMLTLSLLSTSVRKYYCCFLRYSK